MKNSTMTDYTIDRISKREDLTEEVLQYFVKVGIYLSDLFENKFDWKNTPILDLAEKYIVLVCRRNNEIRGHMICYVFKSPLDPKVKILYQLSFHAMPDSGRTAYHLFHKFIDIGKTEANHIITMLTSHTNIKPKTLEGLGFKELETLYRMEI